MRVPALLVAVAVVGGAALPAAASHEREDPAALDLLSKVRSGLDHAHTGETVHVVWTDSGTHAAVASVQGGGGELTVHAPDHWTVHLSDRGGGLVDHARGWHVPFPDGVARAELDPLRRLDAKYRATLGPARSYAGRACREVELHHRDRERLRERLCVADDTGLVLRRETFGADGELVRLAAYLSIDDSRRPLRAPTRPARGQTSPVPLTQHAQEVEALDVAELSSNRTAPHELPGGYEAVGVYALDAGEQAPLQVVYRDGLYSVSLFQQPGRPDWDALPPGRQRVHGLGWRAYEWPGAMPQRLVWEAGGTTYSLVGDAPADELLAIARALPAATEPGLGERLERGLRRLWGWMTGGARG